MIYALGENRQRPVSSRLAFVGVDVRGNMDCLFCYGNREAPFGGRGRRMAQVSSATAEICAVSAVYLDGMRRNWRVRMFPPGAGPEHVWAMS